MAESHVATGMDSVLGYGHHSGQWLAYVKRGWPAAIVLAYGERADVGTGHTTGRTDNGTDRVKTKCRRCPAL